MSQRCNYEVRISNMVNRHETGQSMRNLYLALLSKMLFRLGYCISS